jgi:CRP-like cAMP-binding protein
MSEAASAQLVKNSTLGDELNDQESVILASVMTVKRLKDGEMLVAEGQSDDSLFLLARGSLSVISDHGEENEVVYTMKAGECAGTRAFVDRTPRKATLRSNGDALVYAMSPKDFESLLDTHPRIVYKVMRALFRITHSNLMRMNQETEQLSNYINKTHGRY